MSFEGDQLKSLIGQIARDQQPYPHVSVRVVPGDTQQPGRLEVHVTIGDKHCAAHVSFFDICTEVIRAMGNKGPEQPT